MGTTIGVHVHEVIILLLSWRRFSHLVMEIEPKTMRVRDRTYDQFFYFFLWVEEVRSNTYRRWEDKKIGVALVSTCLCPIRNYLENPICIWISWNLAPLDPLLLNVFFHIYIFSFNWYIIPLNASKTKRVSTKPHGSCLIF